MRHIAPSTLPALARRPRSLGLGWLLPALLVGCVGDVKDDDSGDSGAAEGPADGGTEGSADGTADGTADGAADGTADGGDTGPIAVDNDGDGVTDLDGDCDDADPGVFPGAPDPACDGIDQACTGWADGVYGPEDDVQALIDAAPDGSTLCLEAGSWAQDLHLDGPRALTVRGAGPAATLLSPDAGGRMITAAGGAALRLEGLGFVAGETAGARGEEGLFDVQDATLTLSGVEVRGLACGRAEGCPAALAQVGPGARFEAEDLTVQDIRLHLGRAGAAQGLIFGAAGAAIRLDRAQLFDLRLSAEGQLAGGLLPYAPEGSVELIDVSVAESGITGDESATGVLGGARDLSWTGVSAQRLDFVFGQTVYLMVTQGGAASTIAHSDVRAVRLSGGDFTVGFYVNSGALQIQHSRFADVQLSGSGGIGYGLLVADNGQLDLNHVDLIGNGVSNHSAESAGLSCRYHAVCSVQNSSFNYNHGGEVLTNAAGAIFVDASSALTAAHVQLWANLGARGETINLADGRGVAITGGVLGEPNFVNLEGSPEAWDLHLQPGSPLIDAGDPAETDLDGTRADIGSYGGPLAR